MTRLKLGLIEDDRPVKVTVELPASLHRDLAAYAEALGRQTGQPVSDPLKLIVPMLQRFMTTDRGFAKARSPKPMPPTMQLMAPHVPAKENEQDQ